MYGEQSSSRSGRCARKTSCSGHESGCAVSEFIVRLAMEALRAVPFVDVWREYDGGVAVSEGRLLKASVIIASLGSVIVDGRSSVKDAAVGWFLGTPTPPAYRMRTIKFGVVVSELWSSTSAPT